MALKTYDTKDAVPEDQRESAIETKDGKFVVSEAEDTSGLTSALDTERTKREAAEKLQKKTADELKKAEAKVKAASHGLTDEQLASLREDAVKEERAARVKAEEERDAERTGNRQRDLSGAFKSVAGDVKFLGNRLDDVFALHGSEFDLTDDRKLMVKGKPGIDPKKHMETIAKARPEWVQGTQAAGGGAAGVAATGTGATTSFEDTLKNPSQALAAARASGKTE